MQCKKCQFENTKENKFCSNCGAELYPTPFYKKHPIKFVFSILSTLFFVWIVYAIAASINEINNELSITEKASGYISGDGENTIAVVNIDGVIVETATSSGLSSFSDEYSSAREIKSILEELRNDDTVKAVILRVNSPGGSAAASDEILAEIKRYKKDKGLPVVAYFTDVAASGGYYVSASSDRIIANPATLTGSIGVILSYLNFKELADKYGVYQVVYKSGELKNLADSFSEATDEEAQIMQSVVDDTYNTFVKAVAEGRNLEESYVREIADGRIYSAKQALDVKLVDEIGNFEDSVNAAKKLANINEAKVIEFGQSDFIDELLGVTFSKLNLGFFNINNVSLPFSKKPTLMYLANF